MLREGELDDREIEIEVRAVPWVEIMRRRAWRRYPAAAGHVSNRRAAPPRKVKDQGGIETPGHERSREMINEEELKLPRVENASRTASCSSTKSTRSLAARKPWARMCRARACSATCCPCGGCTGDIPSTARQDPIMCCHRVRRVSYSKPLGPDPELQALADPGRARARMRW